MARGTPAVLLIDQGLMPVRQVIGEDLDVLGLWDYPSVAALATDRGGDLRVIVVHGGLTLDKALIEALPAVGLIASVGAGYECVDVPWTRARGIQICNGAGANAGDVADVAVGLLLDAVCGLTAGDKTVRESRWQNYDKIPPRWSVSQRRVGIVGLGAIGRAVAERLTPFGCPVAWHGPRPKPDAPWPYVATLEALATDSDVLVLTASLDAVTHHMVNRTILDALGPRGILVNVGRGGLVDEDALIAALRDGRLGGAALDVFEQEPTPPERWRDVPNTVLTPHMAGYATAAMHAMASNFAENLRRYFAGEPLLTPVG